MARGIKLLVIVARRGPVGSRRDHRGLAGGGQWRKDASIGVERLVGDQRIGLHRGQQVVRPLQVVCLAAGQEEVDRVAQRVDQGVDLGAQSAARAPDCLVLTSFFWAPALCWWARTMVLSIIAYSLSASAARCWNIRSQTPLLAQRLNRVWIFVPSPNRSGRSRHDIPVRKRYSTASTNSRLSAAVTPTEPSRPGNRFLIRSHWSSRSPKRRIGQPPTRCPPMNRRNLCAGIGRVSLDADCPLSVAIGTHRRYVGGAHRPKPAN